jgi:hypothetical protein
MWNKLWEGKFHAVAAPKKIESWEFQGAGQKQMAGNPYARPG